MELTSKQLSIMNVIVRGNEDGSVVDLDQILERLEYRTTKESLQFSLRALIAHGLIQKAGREKRRGRSRTLIRATEMGRGMIVSKPASFVSAASDDMTEFDEIIEKM